MQKPGTANFSEIEILALDKSDRSTMESADVGDVLIIAYGCEPNASSEPGVGWNFVREISKFAKVHVITRANNKPRIDAALPDEIQSMRDNVSWRYVDIGLLSKLKNRIPFGIQLYYALWQWKTLVIGRMLAKNYKFRLCHHLTYGVMWLSPITAFIMKPFVWGPIGGGDVIPWKFRYDQSLSNLIQESLYGLVCYLAPRVSPLAIAARRRASTIIFRTRSTNKLYPAPSHVKKYVMCETALNESISVGLEQPHNLLSIVCLGRHTYWKGHIYAIKGFHEYLNKGGKSKLVFLGDGPEFDAVKSYCDKHNLHKQVSLPGHVNHDEAQSILEKSDILLHPSFRDGGSWAVLEAMDRGKPVICLNRSGLADMVDDKSGILIDAINPTQVAKEIGAAILRLDKNRALLKNLSRGARDRVNSSYRWRQRKDTIREIYRDLPSG